MTQAVQTVECWDATADSYAATAEPFTSRFCADAVELAEIVPGVTFLDVATGPGAVALAAARAGAQVTAIDFAPAMIARLKARIGDLPIQARRMDGQALALPDASFDRACSVFGVPLFPDWRAGLRELARVVRPGGVVVLGVADNPHGFGPNKLFAEARADCFPDRPATAMVEAMHVLADRERLIAELEACGLSEVAVHTRTHDFVLDPAVIDMSGRMVRDNPVLAGLSAAEAERVVARARTRADELSVDGTVRLPGTAWIAVARKP